MRASDTPIYLQIPRTQIAVIQEAGTLHDTTKQMLYDGTQQSICRKQLAPTQINNAVCCASCAQWNETGGPQVKKALHSQKPKTQGDGVIATGTPRVESTRTPGDRRRRRLQLPSPSREIYEPVEEQNG